MSGAFIAASVAALLAILLEAAKKSPAIESESGNIVLSYHPAYCWIGLILGVAGCLMPIVVSFAHPPEKTSDFVAIFLLFLFFFVLGSHFFIKRRERITLDNEGISVNYAYGRDREIGWNEVESVKYSGGSGKFIVRSANEKIGVSMLMTGIREFAGVLVNKVPADRLTKAEDQLRSYV